MPTYWMITNRNVLANHRGLGEGESRLSYWVSHSRGRLDRFSAWEGRAPARFRDELCAAAEAFPVVEDPAQHAREKHVTLFIPWLQHHLGRSGAAVSADLDGVVHGSLLAGTVRALHLAVGWDEDRVLP